MSETNFNETIMANNIRAERSRCNMTKSKVAKELGVTLTTYKTYEINARNITAMNLYKLSRLFNCNVNDFYMLKHSTNVENE